MTCGQCGAPVQRGDGRYCSHCAAALPDRPRITAEEWVTHVERFEEAEKDPQHAIARGLPAPAPQTGAMLAMFVPFGVLWLAMTGFMTYQFADVDGGMAVFPLLVGLVGALGMGAFVAASVRRARAPVTRVIAVVIDERTHVSTTGMGDQRSTHTAYYATLQLKDGRRLELRTSGAVTGMTTKGDIGLAVVRGAGELIDFHRFARV
jgi:hypothetical protein